MSAALPRLTARSKFPGRGPGMGKPAGARPPKLVDTPAVLEVKTTGVCRAQSRGKSCEVRELQDLQVSCRTPAGDPGDLQDPSPAFSRGSGRHRQHCAWAESAGGQEESRRRPQQPSELPIAGGQISNSENIGFVWEEASCLISGENRRIRQNSSGST